MQDAKYNILFKLVCYVIQVIIKYFTVYPPLFFSILIQLNSGIVSHSLRGLEKTETEKVADPSVSY